MGQIKLRSIYTTKIIYIYIYIHTEKKKDEKTVLKMGENIFKKSTDKGLIPKVKKQFMQLNIRKTKNPIESKQKI